MIQSRKGLTIAAREVAWIQDRFEFLDAEGEVSEGRHLECEDKAAAIDMAGIVLTQTIKASRVEIWDGAYLVHCIKKPGT